MVCIDSRLITDIIVVLFINWLIVTGGIMLINQYLKDRAVEDCNECAINNISCYGGCSKCEEFLSKKRNITYFRIECSLYENNTKI